MTTDPEEALVAQLTQAQMNVKAQERAALDMLHALVGIVRTAGGSVTVPKCVFRDAQNYTVTRQDDPSTDCFIYTVRRNK